ncbi:hypothetical protein [Mycolicibacterium fortuitum]|uniref:hypothetical protein n=1 Tax=Mycolicibacterium fortuitum TaxID=1766 RepID=UPI0026096BDE|nr:hypothetical protein [Mycolicibacterium fortuitum]
MSQFEDAVARARAERQGEATAAAKGQQDAAQIGARLEPELRQLLIEFARHLDAITPARAYKISSGALGIGSKMSPVGIPISVHRLGELHRGQPVCQFSLITLDGQVWVSNNHIGNRHAAGGEFLDLSASALADTLQRTSII